MIVHRSRESAENIEAADTIVACVVVLGSPPEQNRPTVFGLLVLSWGSVGMTSSVDASGRSSITQVPLLISMTACNLDSVRLSKAPLGSANRTLSNIGFLAAVIARASRPPPVYGSGGPGRGVTVEVDVRDRARPCRVVAVREDSDTAGCPPRASDHSVSE